MFLGGARRLELSPCNTEVGQVHTTSCSAVLIVGGAMVRQKGPIWSAVVPAERHFTPCTILHVTYERDQAERHLRTCRLR